ncbi:MAG TPA: transcription antitermination factor NusB [Mycobacteriales bacterium]|nr:transcription antitermination factor NusB [Mycobacteriales bacterium]
MAARSKARKRALDVLFEADQRAADPLATLTAWVERSDPPVPEYARTIVEGVADHAETIDRIVATYAKGWPLDRMPPVDRTVLRIAVYELLWRDDVPRGVVINEAVEMAKALSTDESPGFVNGLLARVGAHDLTA